MTLVPTENAYDSVIATLTDNAGFLNSEEYRISSKHGYDLPGVIAAAYAGYIGQASRSPISREDFTEIMKPINTLASFHDSMVDDLLRDELFEQLEVENCIDFIRPFMSIDLALMWDGWCEKELKS